MGGLGQYSHPCHRSAILCHCIQILWQCSIILGQYLPPPRSPRTSTPILFDPLSPIVIWFPAEVSIQYGQLHPCVLACIISSDLLDLDWGQNPSVETSATISLSQKLSKILLRQGVLLLPSFACKLEKPTVKSSLATACNLQDKFPYLPNLPKGEPQTC